MIKRHKYLWHHKVKMIIYWSLCILLVLTSLYIPYHQWFTSDELEKGLLVIRGNSMNPTIEDVAVVYTQPFLGERGEIAVFSMPEGTDYSDLEDKYLIKRIIALPNESIKIKEDGVYINEKLLEEDYTDGSSNINDKNTYSEMVVSDGEYFVMGDNRNESFDSRAFGPVNKNNFLYSVTTEPNEHTQEVKNNFISIAVFLFSIATLINFLMFFIFTIEPKPKKEKKIRPKNNKRKQRREKYKKYN